MAPWGMSDTSYAGRREIGEIKITVHQAHSWDDKTRFLSETRPPATEIWGGRFTVDMKGHSRLSGSVHRSIDVPEERLEEAIADLQKAGWLFLASGIHPKGEVEV